MSERARRTDPATRGETPEGTGDSQQPWLLTQETPGLDPEPIRQAAGPDWADDEAGRGDEGAETIDEADVETGPGNDQGGPTGR